jgi:hypothetical protein
MLAAREYRAGRVAAPLLPRWVSDGAASAPLSRRHRARKTPGGGSRGRLRGYLLGISTTVLHLGRRCHRCTDIAFRANRSENDK